MSAPNIELMYLNRVVYKGLKIVWYMYMNHYAVQYIFRTQLFISMVNICCGQVGHKKKSCLFSIFFPKIILNVIKWIRGPWATQYISAGRTAVVTQWVRVLVSQAEGWVFESHDRPKS